MLGYVTCEKAELKMRITSCTMATIAVSASPSESGTSDPQNGSQLRCRISCSCLGRRRGEEESISREHCIIHHIKKKTVVGMRLLTMRRM